MTKKHFIELAKGLRVVLDEAETPGERVIAVDAIGAVARVCKQVNPRFDANIFYEACGVQFC